MGGDARFRDRSVVLNGVPGEDIEIPSANPVNYYQAINEPDECETIILDAPVEPSISSFFQPGLTKESW